MRFVSIIPLICVISVSACAPTRMHATAPTMGHNGYANGSVEMVFEQPVIWTIGESPKVLATATTNDGEIFTGRVVQEVNTYETTRQHFDSKDKGGDGIKWSWFGIEDDGFDSETTAHASSKAQAILVGNRGRSMTCLLNLRAPDDGVSGGGIGECKISDGKVIPLQF